MQIRRLLRYVLVPSLALGLAVQGASSALADEQGEMPSKKVRIRIARPKPAQPGAADSPARVETKKSPAEAAMRWAMKELGGRAADGHGAGALKMLQQWFEGGDDVPMSGLRDELKADGWDASSLMHWMHQEGRRMMTMAPMVMQMLRARGMGGHQNSGATRTWHMQGPGPRGMRGARHGGMHGTGRHGSQAHGSCPQCEQAPQWQGRGGRRMHDRGMHDRGMHGRGMHGRGMHGQGMHGQGMGRWGMRRGAMRGHGMGRGRNHQQGFHGGMGHGPRHMQSNRTIILWNDGSGWQRRELPMQQHEGAQGHALPGWLGEVLRDGHPHRQGGHGGHGAHPVRRFAPRDGGPHHSHGTGHMRSGTSWMKMLEGMQGDQPSMSPDALRTLIETLKRQVNALEENDAAQRLAPKSADVELALKGIEDLLKSLGEAGQQDGARFEDMKKMLKGLHGEAQSGTLPSRKVHIRIVKPGDTDKDVEVTEEEVIEEEAVREVEKGK